MKIGILGGTFNPPHIGHLILAQEVCQKAGLDKIFFVPTNISPHKKNDCVDVRHRLQMVRQAVKGEKQFELIDIEIKRGGISYTIDTVKTLKSTYPRDSFYLIIGSDLAHSFFHWKDSGALKRLVKIIVVQREEFPLKKKGHFISVPMPHIGISSTQIRERIKKKFSVKYLVCEDVKKYIDKHKLYQ